MNRIPIVTNYHSNEYSTYKYKNQFIRYKEPDVYKRQERLKLNRGYSDEKIDNIFASQLSESTYREVCREEIDNNHLPEDAFSQIDALMKARQVEKVQKRQTTEE